MQSRYRPITPLAKAAMSGEEYSLVPSTRDGVVLVMEEAMLRAILAGSDTNPPMAQPMVSTRVRLTWCTVLGPSSSKVIRQA